MTQVDRSAHLRDWLTVREFALALGIPYSTLRKQIDRALHSVDGYPFPGGPDNLKNPWSRPIEDVLRVYGSHTRRIDIAAIDVSRYPRETSDRIEAMLCEPPLVAKELPALSRATTPRRGSSGDIVLLVMKTDPARTWTVQEVLDFLERSGQVPLVRDAKRALQATFHRLARSRRVERIAYGLYRLGGG